MASAPIAPQSISAFRNRTMSDLLPKNSTSLERALAEANSVISSIPVDIKTLWNPDTCPEHLLPWLAWALSVDEWDPTWSEERRRAAIRTSVSVHKYKGTIASVREALRSLVSDSRVQEWFNQNPIGNPYTFKVLLDVSQDGVPKSVFNNIAAVIDRARNLRSHLDRIGLFITSDAESLHGSISSIGSEIHIKNYAAPRMLINQTAFVI